jgi:ring-1,2-phenylacetyl-CoA epoxidase subunit PaaC
VNQTPEARRQTPDVPGTDRFREVLNHGDDNLILAQRLSGWVASAPDLEVDIALANIALDHLGVARALLARAGELEGRGRSEDDLAMFRSEREFTNLLLCELPNGDFAQTITRQFLFDAYQIGVWELLSSHPDSTLAGVAGKAIMEARYHLRFSSSWIVRLGDGTDESHRRMEAALGHLWRFVDEMFDDHPDLRPGWDQLIDPVLVEAKLRKPSSEHQRRGGRDGLHTEHLGHLLAEMQSMARSYPGAAW